MVKSKESLKNDDHEKNNDNEAAAAHALDSTPNPDPEDESKLNDDGDQNNGDKAKKIKKEEEESGDRETPVVAEKESDKDQNDEKKKKRKKKDKDKEEDDIGEDDCYNLDNAMEDVDKFISSHDSDEPDEFSIENHKFIEIFLNLFEVKIINYSIIESSEGQSKWGQEPDEDAAFLDSLSRISKLSALIDKHKNADNFGLISNRVGNMHQRAMQMLEDDFKVLTDHFVPRDNPNTEEEEDQESPEETKPDNVDAGEHTEAVMSGLNKIAKAMFLGGYQTECCLMFLEARRHVVDETLSKIGFEAVSIDEAQKMQWETLEITMGKWIELFKQCATDQFDKELKLTKAVFDGLPEASLSIIDHLVWGAMIHILNFAGAVAISKRAGEKLFKFLDMYESLRDNGHAIEKLFGDDMCNDIRTEMATARSRLGEAIITIFCDLENSIMSDTGKTVVPGGAVHPLTRYVMNYLKLACEYKETLEQVFKDHLKIERADSNNRSHFQHSPSYAMMENPSPFSMQLMKVMDLLDSNLESKSKLYKDVSLASIFMMNNGRYILQKVKGSSEINNLLGDNWRRKKSSDLRTYHKNYQRETWNKVLGCLRDDHGLTHNGKVNKPELKERFKNFNAMFDEIHKTQSTWVVSDEQLQSELRVSISAVIIPAYRSFFGRFSQYMTPGRQTEKYIKYQAEDIETYIDDLFDGNAAMAGKRKT